jgi:hypothetical protein
MIHNMTRPTTAMSARTTRHIPSNSRIAKPLVTSQTLDDARFAVDPTIRTRMFRQLCAFPGVSPVSREILNHSIIPEIIECDLFINCVPHRRLFCVHSVPVAVPRRNDKVVHCGCDAADFRGIVSPLMGFVVPCCCRVCGFGAVKVVLREEVLVLDRRGSLDVDSRHACNHRHDSLYLLHHDTHL